MNQVWLESLRARQMELSQQSQQVHDNWKAGRCTSQVAAVLGDWVRRLDVDYPLVACGSASETIYLSHLESGDILAEAQVGLDTAAALIEPELPRQDHVYRILYGDHDGGGTLAIAFYDNLIATSGRQGSVDLWRVHMQVTKLGGSSSSSGSYARLIYQGRMVACQGVLVTSLQFQPNEDNDEVLLWIGTADGRVMAFDTLDDGEDDDEDEYHLPLAARRTPKIQYNFEPGAVILSMSFTNELQLDNFNDDYDEDESAGVGVITTSAGNVHLISTSSHGSGIPAQSSWSFRLPMDVTSARAPKALPTCACFIQHDVTPPITGRTNAASLTAFPIMPSSSSTSYWSIACGGSNGSLYLQQLSVLPNSRRIDPTSPFDAHHPPSPLLPRHWGPTQCVATPMPGLLLSSGQDGSIRVWDVSSTNTMSTTPMSASPLTSRLSSPQPSRPLFRRRFLYQFHGYKVWLKSLWCGSNMGSKSHDGSSGSTSVSPFLVSDGSDNTILVHRFQTPPPTTKTTFSKDENGRNQ